MGKRAAAAVAGSPGKKGRKSEIQTKVSLIVSALGNESLETDAPMGARRMLATGAAGALSSPIEERHQLQDVMMCHIREVLGNAGERLKAAGLARKAAADERDGELPGLHASLEEAQKALDEAQKVAEGHSEKLMAGQEAVHAAAAEVKTVDSSMKVAARERGAMDKERSKYTAIQDGNLKSLLEGEVPTEKEANKACNKIVKDLEKLGAEPAMLASLPQVLLKKPDERKGFDAMVVDSVKGLLDKAVAEVDAKIAENEKKTSSLEQEAVAKAEALETAKAASEACAKVLADCEADTCSKIDATETAKKAVDACTKAVGELRDAQSQAASDESAFSEVLKALDDLAAYSTAVPEEQPAAPVEAPVEAAA